MVELVGRSYEVTIPLSLHVPQHNRDMCRWQRLELYPKTCNAVEVTSLQGSITRNLIFFPTFRILTYYVLNTLRRYPATNGLAWNIFSRQMSPRKARQPIVQGRIAHNTAWTSRTRNAAAKNHTECHYWQHHTSSDAKAIYNIVMQDAYHRFDEAFSRSPSSTKESKRIGPRSRWPRPKAYYLG